jgi:nucleoside-diphosphate-sugar epimerase
MSQRVALFGASGTMGFQAFLELQRRRPGYHVTLLLLPGEKGLRKFAPYARAAGLPWRPPPVPAGEPQVLRGQGLSIVWGDARDPRTVQAVVDGADWVLNAMAVISPAADYRPELARQVNDVAVGHILSAIAAQPGGAQRIGYVHTGSVAQTGNRPVGIHVGRVGDPMNPSVFDAYAITKIAGERRVLESPLSRWVSLRMSFIMPTQHQRLMALLDPIAFHMPLDARLESVTDRDAGYAMVQCLQQPAESPFWRRVYNLGGGPGMRTTAYDYMADVYGQMGLEWEACSERNWYALRNFHLQYYEDSVVANSFLGHQRDDNASFHAALEASMPWYLRAVRWLARRSLPVRRLAERATHSTLRRLAERHRNSPRYWYLHDIQPRLEAFFGGRAAYQAIPDWSGPPPNLDPQAPWRRLEHGYDEEKPVLELADLQRAAAFRGGACLAHAFGGQPDQPLEWECAFGHRFTARPLTVLHAGHWCPTCVQSWNAAERAQRSRFLAQVWYADHDASETQTYDFSGIMDIAGADEEWRTLWRKRRRA